MNHCRHLCLSTALALCTALSMSGQEVSRRVLLTPGDDLAAKPLRAGAQDAASFSSEDSSRRGITIRVLLPADLLTVVKGLRITGIYNGWTAPQPMIDRGKGVFEYSIFDPRRSGQTARYRLYPGGGQDGTEGPDPFERTSDYTPVREVSLKNLLSGKDGSQADAAGSPPITVNVDSGQMFQTMDGFGAALTDSSAWLIGKALLPRQRQNLLRSLFDPGTGAGLSYLRLPMGASDFSLTEHSYDDLPAGQTDYDLKRFSIAYDKAYIIPVLKQIMAVNPHLKVMASPWSAPAWMKDSGKLDGGRLKIDDPTYNAYADYFVRFIQAYAAEGIPIDMITLQNEPWNQTNGYPSMGMDPEDEIRLAKLIGERFKTAKIVTKIVVWDHNWDHPEYPIRVLQDASAGPYIDGAAFHGYAGDVSAQSKVHDAVPDKNLYFTESTGGDFATDFSSNLMWDMTNLLVGSTRDWAKTVLKWNLILDDKNGPHLPGGPGNCRGVVTIHQQTDSIVREEEYYAFAHAARFVAPGARRIFTDAPSSVAFVNPDRSTAMILFNASYNTQRYRIRWKDRFFDQMLPPRSVVTLVWTVEGGPVQSWMTTGDRSRLLARQPDLRFQ